MPIIERWCPAVSCCDATWEAAYLQFESAEAELRKFRKRLIRLNAATWPRESVVVDLFCGRGNGLKALTSLGFTSLIGVDLSETLLLGYEGPAGLYVGDCRDLKLPDRSVDIVIVQGGLHHLPDLPSDLEMTLREIRRVLRPTGRFVVVEPWDTPFLKLVHAFCNFSLARRGWKKLDALATMIERERATYESWLGRGDEILRLLQTHFHVEQQSIGWGKLTYVGGVEQ
jgi:SAM-dependent methyltransferase